MKVYLAGPISGKTYGEAEGWRAHARTVLADNDISAFSPMRAKGYLVNEVVIKPYVDSPEVMSSAKGITTRDRWDCTRADVVLANFSEAVRITIGTCIELGWADAHRIPVVGVLPPGNAHEHPMVEEIIGFKVPTLDEALGVIIAMAATS